MVRLFPVTVSKQSRNSIDLIFMISNFKFMILIYAKGYVTTPG